jgi:hypothetical protein
MIILPLELKNEQICYAPVKTPLISRNGRIKYNSKMFDVISAAVDYGKIMGYWPVDKVWSDESDREMGICDEYPIDDFLSLDDAINKPLHKHSGCSEITMKIDFEECPILHVGDNEVYILPEISYFLTSYRKEVPIWN